MPGRWLLDNTTPSWRVKDPLSGFQRIVTEKRARQIAASVIDQGRSCPNALVLATDSKKLQHKNCKVAVPEHARFLVVDGQHRLWAQHFSTTDANYACVIHVGLSEAEMAELFLEINDNQKRVPSSLRWDLVRLVRPEEDPYGIRASEIVDVLNSQEESPLFQRIDMTGEHPTLEIKQGSLAPEIKSIAKKKTFAELGFDLQVEILMQLFAAIKEKDPDGWKMAEGYLYRNRVFRAFIKLVPDMLIRIKKEAHELMARDFFSFVTRIKLDSLSDEKLKSAQGNAGVKAIADTLSSQMFKK